MKPRPATTPKRNQRHAVIAETMEPRVLLAAQPANMFRGVAALMNASALQAEDTKSAEPIDTVSANYASFVDVPAPPSVFLDTTYTPPVGGTTWNVPAQGSLQTIINSAQLGDTILIQAGTTHTGNFTLPNKTTGSGWITIRTSTPDANLPAPGTRITPAQAGLMAKIVSGNSNAALATQNNAHHYRFIGLEFTVATNVTSNTGIVVLGSGTQTAAQTPNNLIFDRVYIHGQPNSQIQNGMRLNSASTAIIDSYFDTIQSTSFEGHCIGGYNGPGPFKIVNNTFNGGTIPVIFGGATPSVSGLIPSDMEIRSNHFTRPLSWRPSDPMYGGTAWYVKNLFELKNGRRVLFDGNLLEHNWPHTGTTPDGAPQHGYAILLTVRDESDTALWATVSDITVSNNIVRRSNVGVSLYGVEGAGTHRIKIENNLFDDIGLNWGNNDRSGMWMQVQTVGDLIVNHNTVINDGDIMFANGSEVADLDFTNNISNHNAARTINNNRGINAIGAAVGTASLNANFVQYQMTKNAMANASGFTTSYPAGNFFPTNFSAVGFTNLAARNYRLASGSAYRNAGTDGKDLGADFNFLDGLYVLDRTAPLADIANVSPDPRTNAVGVVTINFDEAVSGVNIADFELRRDNVVVPLTGLPVTMVSARQYTIDLSSLTTRAGLYQLTLKASGSGINDGVANAFSADAVDTWLMNTINGTGAADTITIVRPVVGSGSATVTVNGSSYSLITGNFSQLFISGMGGDDQVSIDNYLTSIPASGFAFDGGSGTDRLILVGTPDNDSATMTSTQVTISSVVYSYSTTERVRFDLGAGNDSVTVNSGQLILDQDAILTNSALAITLNNSGTSALFNTTQQIRSLTLGAGTTATLAAGGNKVLVTSGLSLTGSAWFNLNDNDMIVKSSTVSAIEAQVSSGFNFFAWDGPGIRSSAALNDPNNLTTLGVLDGATYTAINGNVFGGRTVADTDVLVKYTYYGDADFNGLVDGTDYALIDTGFANQLTGWFNGDFDHSGIIDGTDYALIDTIFVNQGGPL